MSSACSSSISLQKSMMSQSSGRKSCETVCSSNSSCYLQKKKPINPLAASVRTHVSRNDNVVRQRVMSAKLIKLRNLQSQLNDANYHLMELAKENRALKTLQKRQDKALNNYEGINADLPRLIKSHEEENRTLLEKNRSLRRTVKELTEQLKIKDDELMSVRDQLKHLTNLSKDKHLVEREKLQELLEESRMQIKKYETEVGLLNRKLMLEMKNSKQKLNNEIIKHKRCQRELTQALAELTRLAEGKEKNLKCRFEKSPTQRQSLSMVCLTSQETEFSTSFDQRSDTSSDLKLEPIHKRADSAQSQETMQSPVEKIKARLSANQTKHITINQITEIMEKLGAEEENIKKSLNGSRKLSADEKKINSMRPVRVPSGRLEKINYEELQNQDHIKESLDSCRTKLEETAAHASSNVDKLLEKFELTKVEDDELNQTNHEIPVPELSTIELEVEDVNLVDKIWSEEFAFRKGHRDTNGNVTKRDPVVALENKKKLLATLRDIDNGKSIEESGDNNNVDRKKNRLIKELFG